MNYRPALRHSHALVEGPVVEQVKCQVQLQHSLIGLQTCLLDERLTVEHILNPRRILSLPFSPS